AEAHVANSSTGPLIRAALIDQFTRLRNGDRFWYQNQTISVPGGAWKDPSGNDIPLRSVTLADVIAANTTNARDHLQDNVFFFKPTISGTVFNDANHNGVLDAGEDVLGGRTVQLEDPNTGAVLLTTTTNSSGQYSFDVFAGLTTGRFNVRAVPKNTWRWPTTSPALVTVFKGDQTLLVNFGNAHGSALLAATPGTGGAAAEPLTQEMLQPIVAEAVARWQAAGVAPEVLGHFDVQIADLPDGYLGWAAPGVITIDVNAAGYGWFVDPTPGDDAEFPAALGSS